MPARSCAPTWPGSAGEHASATPPSTACARQEGAELTFPFGEQTAVYKVGARCSRSPEWSGDPLQITLKCEPEHADALRSEHSAIRPGYHMNKRHWITVTLDGSLPAQLIEELIEDSYDLVAPRSKRA